MTAFLLELLTEEIPARMQARAIEQLVDRFTAGCAAAALSVGRIEGFVTPRRLALIAHDVAPASVGTSDERRGPRADAPAGAIAGFLKSTGLAREQLEERDTPKGRFLYATIASAGRPAAAIVGELVATIVGGFDWPKSMRWGDASASTASLRWVRPLSGVVALLGAEVVPVEIAGIASGRVTRGHRFMSSGAIAIESPATYAAQLRAAHVILDAGERRAVIVAGAEAAAADAGLRLIADDGLVAENAGLTEWPVLLLGRFDPAFLDVPREVIQLTMRTNQKYFACVDAGGALAPAFVCVANIAAADGGAGVVAGNAKVLAARLADAKFFWDADRAVTLESRLPKLANIVFHEKLGTVADKVARVAKLARWLVESGAVKGPLHHRKSDGPPPPEEGEDQSRADPPPLQGEGDRASSGAVEGVLHLADLAFDAARLCKADLVSATVGEFPEVQGIAGGHLALAERQPPEVAAAIRDHYKPVGPSDAVPTAPVTVAVALADKLDTLVGFFGVGELPTGSRDPFSLRRAAIGALSVLLENGIRLPLARVHPVALQPFVYRHIAIEMRKVANPDAMGLARTGHNPSGVQSERYQSAFLGQPHIRAFVDGFAASGQVLLDFLADRLKVQQRDAGIRPDVIQAVFALGGEDDLVRLVARAKALQAFLGAPDGGNLLAGYKRGANIVRIEEGKEPGVSDGPVDETLLSEPAEVALGAALDAAVPEAAAAVAAEDFVGAMTALARLRPAVDAFFEHVTVNAHEAAVRRNRLALLARLRTAVHSVADFSAIEG